MPTQAIAAQLQSNLMSLWDWGKPEFNAELHRRYGKQGGQFLGLIRYLGRERMISQDSWIGFEDNWIVENFTELTGFVAPGAGNPATFTLSPADVNALLQFYPRLDFIVTIPGNEVQAMIRAIDVTNPLAPTLTVTPVRATDDIGAIAAGTIISITNGGWGEGSDQPDPAQRGFQKRTFYAQIFKEAIGASGTQITNAEYFNKFADDGTTITGVYSLAMMDCEYRLSLIEDGAYLLGRPNTNNLTVRTGVPGAGNPITLTQGIIPYIRDSGNPIPYVPGTLQVTDFDQIDLWLASQGVTDQYVLCLNGARLAHEWENVLVNYIKDTAVDFTRITKDIFGDNQALAVNVAFTSINKGGRTFLFKRMDNFSNPKTYGAAGYNMDQYGLMLPMNKIKDPQTGASLPNFGSCYKGKGAYNRRYEVWDILGAGGNTAKYVSTIDAVKHELRGNHGFEVYAANQLMMFYPS